MALKLPSLARLMEEVSSGREVVNTQQQGTGQGGADLVGGGNGVGGVGQGNAGYNQTDAAQNKAKMTCFIESWLLLPSSELLTPSSADMVRTPKR